MEYTLEIYVGKAEDATQTFRSDQPFGAISKGDYIFADNWDRVDPDWKKGGKRARLVVRAVEHRIWVNSTGEPRHQIAVTVAPDSVAGCRTR